MRRSSSPYKTIVKIKGVLPCFLSPLSPRVGQNRRGGGALRGPPPDIDTHEKPLLLGPLGHPSVGLQRCIHYACCGLGGGVGNRGTICSHCFLFGFDVLFIVLFIRGFEARQWADAIAAQGPCFSYPPSSRKTPPTWHNNLVSNSDTVGLGN